MAHTIRQLNHKITKLNKQISQLTEIHEEDAAQIKQLRNMMDIMRQTSYIEERRLKDEIDTVIAERNVYRSLVLKMLNIRD